MAHVLPEVRWPTRRPTSPEGPRRGHRLAPPALRSWAVVTRRLVAALGVHRAMFITSWRPANRGAHLVRAHRVRGPRQPFASRSAIESAIEQTGCGGFSPATVGSHQLRRSQCCDIAGTPRRNLTRPHATPHQQVRVELPGDPPETRAPMPTTRCAFLPCHRRTTAKRSKDCASSHLSRELTCHTCRVGELLDAISSDRRRHERPVGVQPRSLQAIARLKASS